MDADLMKTFESFCDTFSIKTATDLAGLSSVLELYILQGIPDGCGGYIGIDEDRRCQSCSMIVDAESLPDYTKEESP